MTSSTNPRVLHVINSLDLGGAETLLVRLLEELGDERSQHSVLSLRARRPLTAHVEELGVPVQSLGMGGRPTPFDVVRLGRALRESRADIIQTWLMHSNFLAGLTARAVVPRTPVVWGVHISEVSRATLGRKSVVVQRCEAACSWFVPSRIVACSLSSSEEMSRMRYRRRRIVTIPNGFDVDRFKPDPAAREDVRRELGLSPTAAVIGHVARWHPVKDHPTLLAAAGEVLAKDPDVRFVLCGSRVEPGNPELRALAEPLGDRILLLGHRDDLPRILNACDLAVSSSAGEALPLAIGEAMATGLPVVATRCGDSAELVADTGAITPVGEPTALAEAMIELLGMAPEARAELGRKARTRISTNYSMRRMVDQYHEVWSEFAPTGDRPPAPPAA